MYFLIDIRVMFNVQIGILMHSLNSFIIDLIYTDPSKDLRTTDRRLLQKC